VETPLQRRPVTATRSRPSDFFVGMRLLGRGFGIVLSSPRLLVMGLVPGVIAAAVVLSGLAALVYYLDKVAAFVTPFADDWSADARNAVRLVASIGLLLGSVVLAALTFTVLTLTIGDPFYEAISKRVDDRFGGAPDVVDAPWYRTFRRNLVDSVRLLALTAGFSVVLFVTGFIPVVGQTVVPVLDATVGGWFMALEVTGIPFNRRAYRLRDRRRLLAANRALALGFGVPVFLLLLVPFGALFVMPGAVAGATLLTRRVLGQPYG